MKDFGEYIIQILIIVGLVYISSLIFGYEFNNLRINDIITFYCLYRVTQLRNK